MTVVIASGDSYQTVIRRYDTDDPFVAKRLFLTDWAEGSIQWDYFEYFGPSCTVANPAFPPVLVSAFIDEDDPGPEITEGVHTWTWWHVTGIHGSDEHYVVAHFIAPVVDFDYGVI